MIVLSKLYPFAAQKRQTNSGAKGSNLMTSFAAPRLRASARPRLWAIKAIVASLIDLSPISLPNIFLATLSLDRPERAQVAVELVLGDRKSWPKRWSRRLEPVERL